eukprot:4159258-Amphidinium_carterae.1
MQCRLISIECIQWMVVTAMPCYATDLKSGATLKRLSVPANIRLGRALPFSGASRDPCSAQVPSCTSLTNCCRLAGVKASPPLHGRASVTSRFWQQAPQWRQATRLPGTALSAANT